MLTSREEQNGSRSEKRIEQNPEDRYRSFCEHTGGYDVFALLVHEPVGSDELVAYDDLVV